MRVRKSIPKILLLSILLHLMPAGLSAVSPVIRVAFSDAPPFSFHDSRGEHQGLYVDLIREFARLHGYQLAFVDGTWSQCLERTMSGACDLIMTITVTGERRAWFDFASESVLTEWTQVIGLRDEAPGELSQLNGLTMGIETGDISGQAFKSFAAIYGITGLSYREFPTFADMFKAIIAGEVQAGVAYSSIDLSAFPRIVKTPIVVHSSEDTFAVGKGRQTALLHQLDRQLVAWKADLGSAYYAAFKKHYHRAVVFEATARVVPQWLLVFVGILGGTALASTLVIRALTIRLSRSNRQLRELNESLERKVSERSDQLALSAQNLMQAEKRAALGRITVNVAHNLNTPIGIIMVAITHLQENVTRLKNRLTSRQIADAELAGFLETVDESSGFIKLSTEKARELVEHFKLLSSDYSAERMSEMEMPDHLVALWEVQTSGIKGLRLTLDSSAVAAGSFTWYPSALYQIMSLLLSNAVEHGFVAREEGRIRLGLRTEPDGWFVFRFENDGQRIPPDELPRLMEPFPHAGVIRQGGGMGLAIIHSILLETTRLDHFSASNTDFGVCFEIRAQVKSA